MGSGTIKYVSSIIILALSVYFFSPILMPFFLGALLAYLADPLVEKLKQLHVPRIISVIIVFFIVALGLVGLLFWLLPLLAAQIVLLGQKFSAIFDWLQTSLVPWVNTHLGVADDVNLVAMKKQFASHLAKSGGAVKALLSTATHSTAAIVEFVTNLVLVPVVAFYLMRDWPLITRNLNQTISKLWGESMVALVSDCDDVISAFFKGQLLVMICLGVIYSIGLWLVGIKVALIIGMISGLVAIVPYLGFIVGIVAASVAALVEYHSFGHVAMVWGVYAVGQCIESMVLTPMLVGDKIGLHPVVVIFSVLAGGALFGFLGILLALPVAASIKVFLTYAIEQ